MTLFLTFWHMFWHMKTGINNFYKKHPGSMVILNLGSDPLRVWKKIKALFCSDVSSILTRGMMMFC